MQNNIFETVKKQLSIRDVAEHYGLEVNRGGFVSCPFHADKNPSMKLYEEDNCEAGSAHYHCYGCGTHGDVTDLVGGLFNLSPLESAQKLAQDFGIAVDGCVFERKAEATTKSPKASIKAKMMYYDYAIKKQRTCRLLADYCDYLNRRRVDLAPKSQDERPNPLFLQALCDISKFEYYRDEFTFGSVDDKIAFMRDFADTLSGIERVLGNGKACQAERA